MKMKKLFVIILITMTCTSMSGIAASFITNTPPILTPETHIQNIPAMEQLTKSAYKYLNLNENPTTSEQPPSQNITVPWIHRTSNIFEWWISITYNDQIFQKQLNISIQDFQQKFLKHPYYTQDAFFNIDNDPEDDIKVSFGFYWETILNTKTNEEYKSLEDMVKVRQINSGPANLTAGMEVWSEIHVNWKLVNALNLPAQDPQSSGKTAQHFPLLSSLIQLLKDKAGNLKEKLSTFLKRILETIRDHEKKNPQPEDPQPLTADNDYFAVGVGYRTKPGDRIPQYVEKRFAFAKDNIFSPAIFQQTMRTEPSGTEPLELLYGFKAYNGTTNDLKYDVAFSVTFNPFITLTTQFIPLGGYIYYHFDTDSQHNSETTITYTSDIHLGNGNSTSLSLAFDKIDSTMAQAGSWMSFGLRKDPHGFDYEANHVYDVAVIIDSPFFSQKVKIIDLPETLSYEWKIFDDFQIQFLQGKLFFVYARGYADVTMSSPLGGLTVYYPKFSNPDQADVPFLQANNIPSSRRLEAMASLTIQNDSMLQVDLNGYVDLTKSGPLGDITVFYPKADPSDPQAVLMEIPAGAINSQRISAEATVYIDPENLSNPENYVYGKVQRQADSNFNEMDFYLPDISIPVVQITDIPAQAYVTGTFWWNQLKGSGRAERSTPSQNPDPVHFNLVFDNLVLSDVLGIGNGHIQTDFKIANDGYFQFDTSHDVIGNSFSVADTATGNSLAINASTVSAQNFAVDWGLNTSGPQPQIEDLSLSGSLTTLNNFGVALVVNGKSIGFSGDWTLGESGGFSIDLQQDDDVRIDLIHLDNYSGKLDLNGYVILSNALHYDMSWKWSQGTSLEDPGYFKINEGTNQPNLKTIGLCFTYKDDEGLERWGANITLQDFGVYVCVIWYWQEGFHIWPVIQVNGGLSLAVLLNYNWYQVWP